MSINIKKETKCESENDTLKVSTPFGNSRDLLRRMKKKIFPSHEHAGRSFDVRKRDWETGLKGKKSAPA